MHNLNYSSKDDSLSTADYITEKLPTLDKLNLDKFKETHFDDIKSKFKYYNSPLIPLYDNKKQNWKYSKAQRHIMGQKTIIMDK